MLDVLTKFGGYRIDHFEQNRNNADAFVFYVRGGLVGGSSYSLEAKQQLYYGLAMIRANLGLEKLAGVFVDVNDLENLGRPAYRELKREVLSGEVTRVLILDRSALFGAPAADRDMEKLHKEAIHLEVFTLLSGELQAIMIEPAIYSLAV